MCTVSVQADRKEWLSLNDDGGKQIEQLQEEFRVTIRFDIELGISISGANEKNCDYAKEAIERSLGIRAETTYKCLHHGWLNKQGGAAKQWRRRYFRLEFGGRLIYYLTDQLDEKPLGVIPMPSSKLVMENPEAIGRRNVFSITPSVRIRKKTYLLSANSEEEFKAWYAVLEKHTQQGFIHPGAVKEGYLVKCGNSHKTWKTRYFVLKRDQLEYYREKTDTAPVGIVDLTLSVKIMFAKPEKYKRDYILEVTPGYGRRTYLLQCENSEEQENWAATLRVVNAERVRFSEIGEERPNIKDGSYQIYEDEEDYRRDDIAFAPDGLPIPEIF